LGRKLEVEIEESERDLDFLYKKCPIFRGFYVKQSQYAGLWPEILSTKL
jgi:hypothetical protein